MSRPDSHRRRPRFGRTLEEAGRADRPGVCPIGDTRERPRPPWARMGILWLRGPDGTVSRIIPRDDPDWRHFVRRKLFLAAARAQGLLTGPGPAEVQ